MPRAPLNLVTCDFQQVAQNVNESDVLPILRMNDKLVCNCVTKGKVYKHLSLGMNNRNDHDEI